MGFLDRITSKVAFEIKDFLSGFKDYIKNLLFPLWLFPIKLVTYTFYYLVVFTVNFIIAVLGLIWDVLSFPFKSLKNFLKSLFYLGFAVYMFFSFLVIADYINKQYGSLDKMFCGVGVTDKLKNSVVRIEGSYGEGSGFFVNKNQVLTNFHVINNEVSPKVVLPDGKLVTPTKIVGDRNADLALLTVTGDFTSLVLPFPVDVKLSENEQLISAGYALGSNIKGNVTIVKGNFVADRKSKKDVVNYIQTNLTLVPGMSGGPLVDQCGNLIGINTMGVAGLSLFISAKDAYGLIPNFTDNEVAKINVDPSKSPEDAVYAFYTYLKARRMQDGFNLLSKKYLEKTNFTEWTNRFTNVLDVQIYKSEKYFNTDTVFVKFSTKNWVDGEVEDHFYEGTWQTVKEDGVYKMNKANIKEVKEPGWEWFYNF